MSAEDLARSRKVQKLVDLLDDQVRSIHHDPHNPAEAVLIATRLRDESTLWWAKLARIAGVSAPSERSIALVIDRYEQRGQQPTEVAS